MEDFSWTRGLVESGIIRRTESGSEWKHHRVDFGRLFLSDKGYDLRGGGRPAE